MSHPEHGTLSASPDLHEVDHHLATYKKIIIGLSVLTAIEFGVSYMMAEKHVGLVAGILVLVCLAFVKAIMVARFFMHLKYDPRILGLIAVTPLVLATPLNIICCFDAIKGPSI